MTITISNLTVATSAPAETVVGVLTATDAGAVVPCDFILSKKASGFFAVAANNLVAVWSAPPAPGYYPLRVRAVGIDTRFSSSATFVVNVIAAPSAPPQIVQATHGGLALTNAPTYSGSTPNFGSNCAAGNVIVVGVAFRDTTNISSYTVAVNDSLGTGYSLQASNFQFDKSSSRDFATLIYSGTVPSTGTNAISVSVSGGVAGRGGAVFAVEVSAIDPNSSASGFGLLQTSGIISLNNPLSFTGRVFSMAVMNLNVGSAENYIPNNADFSALIDESQNFSFAIDNGILNSATDSPTNFQTTFSGGGGNTMLGAIFPGLTS